MTFNKTLFSSILNDIEQSLSFTNDDISTPYGWALNIHLKVQDLFDKYPDKNRNEIKYIIEILSQKNYIKFCTKDHTLIDNVTDDGIQFIFSYLHNIEFI